MRDTVIRTITKAARKDRNIMFLSADFGAPALDDFRHDLPDQFVQTGIAEQHMIDLAAGLALSGKKVFCYAMAPFITCRCYEQIKCSLSAMNLPVTLIGVGVGLGYDSSSMTHIAVEDIAIMRAINHLEILTPTDNVMAELMTKLAIEKPALRYLRLDRQPQPTIYGMVNLEDSDALDRGFTKLRYGHITTIIACGNLVHTALAVSQSINPQNVQAYKVGVIDLYRVKPINGALLAEMLSDVGSILTIEEQLLEGGLGAAVIEALVEATGGLRWKVKRLGIRDGFSLINGDRMDLHAHFGMDLKTIEEAVLDPRSFDQTSTTLTG